MRPPSRYRVAATVVFGLGFAAIAGAAPRPADSLAARWREEEREARDASAAGDAALSLGQLHYARGEYRQASVVLTRAAARLSPERKPEARYWAGLAFLALGENAQARAALDEVVRAGGRLRPRAQLGVAYAWDAEERPERAFGVLTSALAQGAGDEAPAVLERYASLADRLHRPRDAKNARTRLKRDFPESLEAARAVARPAPEPSGGPYLVQAGAFVERARADALAGTARRGGFPEAHVVERRGPREVAWVVMLGGWPTPAAATDAATRATRLLGLRAQVVRP